MDSVPAGGTEAENRQRCSSDQPARAETGPDSGGIFIIKRACNDLLRALLRVSLFERHHARLKKDVVKFCKRLK